MDDDCPICESYQPKRYGPCSHRCEWLYKNLTPEQLIAMRKYVAEGRKRNEAAEEARKKQRQEESDRANYQRLKEKYANQS